MFLEAGLLEAGFLEVVFLEKALFCCTVLSVAMCHVQVLKYVQNFTIQTKHVQYHYFNDRKVEFF